VLNRFGWATRRRPCVHSRPSRWDFLGQKVKPGANPAEWIEAAPWGLRCANRDHRNRSREGRRPQFHRVGPGRPWRAFINPQHLHGQTAECNEAVSRMFRVEVRGLRSDQSTLGLYRTHGLERYLIVSLNFSRPGWISPAQSVPETWRRAGPGGVVCAKTVRRSWVAGNTSALVFTPRPAAEPVKSKAP